MNRSARVRSFFYLAAVLVVIGAFEISLRLLGFGQGALYVADPDYEYMHAPNQRTKPFGNLVETNQYGMRSRKIEPEDDVRVLVLGDSVINGGNPMPQQAVATTLLENRLQARFRRHARALNISAGGWGPDNAAAFLRKHGLFGTRAIIAVFSSDDLGDIMTHEPIVGLDPSFANSRPTFVLFDAWTRYAWPRIRTLIRGQPNLSADGGINKFTGQVNPGWLQLRDICLNVHVSLHVVLHKGMSEYLAGDFNEQGHQLIKYLHGIHIDPVYETGFTLSSYRDNIHLSPKGHADLAQLLERLIQ